MGRLKRLEDRNGHGLDFTYDDQPYRGWECAKPIAITDPFGRSVQITYDAPFGNRNVSKVTLPDGREIHYYYNDMYFRVP